MRVKDGQQEEGVHKEAAMRFRWRADLKVDWLKNIFITCSILYPKLANDW